MEIVFFLSFYMYPMSDSFFFKFTISHTADDDDDDGDASTATMAKKNSTF